ncbi:SDR family NAD(P)-dependent oxidoreductase [Ralstonia pseudosolanacearum]
MPDQSGKGFIVTGANTGLGLETSRVLAARGARVLLACRDQSKAQEAMARIRQPHPNADLAFLPLDLADLASVRTAAGQAMTEPRIDALINNAGVMTPPLMRTAQGFELQFGVNHLGGLRADRAAPAQAGADPGIAGGRDIQPCPSRGEHRLG